jgi:squalene-hopene/tetraprenyl-beta-curcumene cyclase
MNSGQPDSQGSRFDFTATASSADRFFAPQTASSAPLDLAIRKTQKYLLDRQHPEGYWVGELEGDTILESEYMLLLAWLGKENEPVFQRCANYILHQQNDDGGWSLYPGGPLEISSSVKAYFALKIAGHDPEAEYMVRARDAVLAAGGAENVNSFTRYYLALLGIIGYHQVPAVPPELILLPSWMPFNIYEMSSWSRTIIIPLSLLWHFKPVRKLPDEWKIDELFHDTPEQLPVSMPPSKQVDELKSRHWIDWHRFFQRVDRGLKLCDRIGLTPFRKTAVKRAEQWMLERFELSDGLGAIFPPIIWSVVGLRCLGYAEDSPEVVAQLHELEKLWITEGDRTRLQPCKSPVWDTAITTIAMRESGVSADHPALRKSVRWLLSKEVKHKGDWSLRSPQQPPGGWYFEFNNEFYPDVDDSIMVTMALWNCLPQENGSPYQVNWLQRGWSPHANDEEAVAVVNGSTPAHADPVYDIDLAAESLPAMKRAIEWVLCMQNSDGGWGAFDRDNTREVFTKVPFADHNAMIDPSWADISARVLEMLSLVNWDRRHPAIKKALNYIWSEQEPDGSWFGRWGVNYIYGTWQVLVGLTQTGIPRDDPRIQAAAQWLADHQQENGGWGETACSYDDPSLRGQGPTTASQTAWALLGLIAAGLAETQAVRRGIEYLLSTQKPDGSWDEPWFTGTGFPKVFYLRYHYYRLYFPLSALGKYRQALRQRTIPTR